MYLQVLILPLLLVAIQVQAQSTSTSSSDEDISEDNKETLSSYAWLETSAFSPGIMMIFNNYIASVTATIGDYRRLTSKLDNDSGVTVWNATPASRAQARSLIRKGAKQAIVGYIVWVAITAPIVTLLAQPLDQRMLYIIHGLSRVTATVCVTLLSIRVAHWLGLYNDNTRLTYAQQYKTKQRIQLMGTTAIELQHAVRWSVFKKLLRPYFVLLFLMQQGADADESGRFAVPASIVTGFVTGTVIDYGMYKVRRWQDARIRWWLSIALVAFLCVVAIGTLYTASYFIAYVWDDSKATEEDLEDSLWPYWALGVGVVLLPLAHACVWLRSNNFFCTSSSSSLLDLDTSNKEHDISTTPYKPRMAMSILLSGRLDDYNDEDTGTTTSVNGNGTLHNITTSQEYIRRMEDIDEDDEEENENPSDVDAELSQKDMNDTTAVDAEKQSSKQQHVESNDLQNETEIEDVDMEESSPAVPITTEEGGSTNETSFPTESTIIPPTTRELLMRWKCCGCVRGKDKTTAQKICSCGIWTVYVLVCSICLFAVVVNIGASQQQEAARAKLPFVFEELYKYIDEGPVCAFDNRGAESNITTFADREAAHEAGFLILHCGACAAVRRCFFHLCARFISPNVPCHCCL
jgi:hypothetical protein